MGLNGRIYTSKAAARAAGVPESDIAEIFMDERVAGVDELLALLHECQEVRFSLGPFIKDRRYKRMENGQLVRVKAR